MLVDHSGLEKGLVKNLDSTHNPQSGHLVDCRQTGSNGRGPGKRIIKGRAIGLGFDRSRAHIQTVGLNAEKKMIGFEPKGEVFLLTFPLVGPYR